MPNNSLRLGIKGLKFPGPGPRALTYSLDPTFSANFKTLTAMPSWATLTRNSQATLMDSAGCRIFAPNNLVANGNFTTFGFHGDNVAGSSISATGLPDPDGGSRAVQITFGGINTEFYCSAAVSQALKKRASIWVKGVAGQTIGFLCDDDGGLGNVTTVLTGGWQQIHSATKNASNTSVYCDLHTYDINDGFGVPTARVLQIYLPVIAVVEDSNTAPRPQDQVYTTGSPYYGPRFGYEYRNGFWVRGGLVFEGETRSNLLPGTDINDTANDWGSHSATIDQDGTTIAGKKAWRMRPDNGGGAGTALTTANMASAQIWTFISTAASNSGNNPAALSVDYKYVNQPYVYVNIEWGSGSPNFATAVFNLSGTSDQDPTETFVSANGVILYAKAKYRGNGEWRIYFVAKCPGGDSTFVIPVWGLAPKRTSNSVDANGNIIIPADGSGTIPANAVGYWMDPMLEVASYTFRCSSEFVPIGTTRSAELIQINNPALALLAASASWSYAASFRIPMPYPTGYEAGDLLAVDDGLVFNNYLELTATSSTNFATTPGPLRIVAWGGNNNAEIDGPLLNPAGISNRIALSMGGGIANLAANGRSSQALTAGAENSFTANNSSPVYIGSYETFDALTCWLERIDFWNTKLPPSYLERA